MIFTFLFLEHDFPYNNRKWRGCVKSVTKQNMNVNYHLKMFEIKIYTSGINCVVPNK